jgi:triosephosphate isomerase (TIM)
MRRLIFAANWKMHHGPAAARSFAARFKELVPPAEGRELWFCPPAVSLLAAADAFAGRADVRIGAQSVHWEPKGAFTGEISVPLVCEAGATGALVGHSERRHLFGETDEQTAKKMLAVLGGGLTPILCVGEKLAEREAGRTEHVVQRQLTFALDGLTADQLGRVVIAYEPVWAIGTGKVATPQDAQEVIGAIRTRLAEKYTGGTADRIRILYGGSVKHDNVASIIEQPDIDGALVGGASIDAEGFVRICRLGK